MKYFIEVNKWNKQKIAKKNHTSKANANFFMYKYFSNN